jgi:diacylglycerol kinase (ATP)
MDRTQAPERAMPKTPLDAAIFERRTAIKDPRLVRALPRVKLVAENPVLRAFHYAFEGIIYATRTQLNMRIHWIAAALVLAATLYLRLQRPYVIGIVITVAVVLGFELVNTAVEAIIDLMIELNHPLAKVAKDASAGAVLVVAFAALIVGYLTFYEGILAGGDQVYRAALALPANAVFITMVIVGIVTIVVKARIGHGSALQGGAVSGHAALAFAAATFIALLSKSALLASLAIFLAVLVTQSRVESGIHSAREVFWGGLLGAGVSYGIWTVMALPVVL